jgi:hypothetical protein
MRTTFARYGALASTLLLGSCSGDVGGAGGLSSGRGSPGGDGDDGTQTDDSKRDSSSGAGVGKAEPPAARLRRLTLSQYENSIRDLLGTTVDSSKLTPIPPLNGMRAIGASTIAVPERDVEIFFSLAESVSSQVFSDGAARQKLTGCDAKQAACAEKFLTTFARRAFRRPVSEEERTRYVALLSKATQATGDGWSGLRVAVSALLQSPNVLYRAELGEVDAQAATQRRLNDFEVAARLSFFLWDSAPDDALLDAAASGALATKEGLESQAKRLLAAPRAAQAVDELFSDYLQLHGLDSLTKLPETYPQATATLPEAMREETLTTLRELVFKRGGDFRDVFKTTKTFVNAELAKLYGLRAPSGSGFSEVELPASAFRAGLVMQASFLALHAHPSRSSPTLRGKFIRESLLCRSIPPPPNNVETMLPNTGAATTARQKLSAHRENPACAGCHALMDPIGLSLETFDGIGAYRKSENGLAIDTSGELDDVTFSDARGLSMALAAHPDVAACFVKTLLRYARGTLEHKTEADGLDALSAKFASLGYKMQDLMLAIIADRSFRYVGALQ